MVALTAGNPDLTELKARDTSKERSVCESEDLTRGNPEQTADVTCAMVWYPATDLAETMRTVRDGEYTGFGAEIASP